MANTNIIEQIGSLVEQVPIVGPPAAAVISGGDQSKKDEVAAFGNMLTDFHLNETCMVLIVIYILLFMYKKEVMAMVNKFLK
tara:strand:+ start:127 stop:372 length:246 start_codon:yes stop_codon:yes gene_type:complete